MYLKKGSSKILGIRFKKKNVGIEFEITNEKSYFCKGKGLNILFLNSTS